MRANAPDRPNFYVIGKKSRLPIAVIGNVGNVISSLINTLELRCFFRSSVRHRGDVINPASMKQALLASARRVPDANIFEQGGGARITVLLDLSHSL